MKPFQGLNDFTLSGVLEKLKNVPMDEHTAESLYLPGYERMLTYFGKQHLSMAAEEEIEFKAQLVGSWLPRCFRTYGPTPSPEVFDTFKLFDNKGAKNITRIMEWMDSLSGATKMLHFDNPSSYPIYDSVIANTIGERYSVKGYISFATKLRNLITQIEQEETIDEIIQIVHIGKIKPRNMRAIELALYLIGLEIKKTTSENETLLYTNEDQLKIVKRCGICKHYSNEQIGSVGSNLYDKCCRLKWLNLPYVERFKSRVLASDSCDNWE